MGFFNQALWAFPYEPRAAQHGPPAGAVYSSPAEERPIWKDILDGCEERKTLIMVRSNTIATNKARDKGWQRIANSVNFYQQKWVCEVTAEERPQRKVFFKEY